MNSTRPYRIEVPGQRARTAVNRRSAEKAMGSMMQDAPNGTVGRIVFAGEVVEQAICASLGWGEIA